MVINIIFLLLFFVCMDKKPINIVWLKRDLRLRDHVPLKRAIEAGRPLLLMYFFEPSLMAAPQYATRHWRFTWESLQDLQRQLQAFGIPFYILNAEVVPALQRLAESYHIAGLFSHQETGLKATFDRDRAVQRFCRARNIPWYEFPQDGVVRGRRHRKGWWEQWQDYFTAPLEHPDCSRLQPLRLPMGILRSIAGSPLPAVFREPALAFQPGGETPARRYLHGFLEERSTRYARDLSKPLASRRGCSRLSPYLAYGNISPREVWQWAERHKRRPGLARPLAFFQDRLWWRSHYMQKLESEWQIEVRAINPTLDALDRGYNEELFRAWAEGRTGFPIIDASMRCLHANGWLNFRMRAMLVTFVTFTLWQDWKAAAVHLARLFLDFEPGIHYGQFQMQAGLSGYHPLRIFSPILQTEQYDPDGAFIYRYLPELQGIPAPLLAAPWTMTTMEQQFYSYRPGSDYPVPLVDYETTTRQARERYWAFRQQPAVREYLPELWKRHCLPKNIEKYAREWR